MAKRNVPTEAELILKNLDITTLSGLNEITRSEEVLTAVRRVLTFIQTMDRDKILRNAGGVHSMDDMINSTVDQSFYRGRISLTVLVNAIVTNSPKYLEKAMEIKK